MWINRWLPEDFITFALNEVNMGVCVFMASLIFKPTFPLWCDLILNIAFVNGSTLSQSNC